MKWVLLISFFLATPSLWAVPHDIPQTAEDQGPDIPSVGSSLFDKLYSKQDPNGQVVYDVPFPMARLVDKVADMDGDFVHSMFPFSRSLQRPQDLSYDPLLNPRIVFAPRSDHDSLTRGKIFFGYVKAKDQIEVISYNDEAGRFEYQIVKNYSTSPEVYYVDRGKCLSCHQGQAPIFSPPGWQDSSLGIMGHMIARKVGLEDNRQENRPLLLQELFGPVKSREEVAVFDSLVRESNQIALDERTWVHGCGEDRACRLGLLLNTVSPNSIYSRKYYEHAQQVLAQSPLRQQRYFSSFLTSSAFGTVGVIRRYNSIDQAVHNPQALLDIIGLLYKLTPRDNPATPRPLSLAEKDLATPLTSFLLSDIATLKEEVPDTNRVAEILIEKFKSGDPIFAKDSINKLEIMQVILEEAGSSKAESYSAWLTRPTPEKHLFEGPLPPAFQQRQLNQFSRHCSKCHAVGFRFPPQFLLGSEAEVVEQMQGLKRKIVFKLENNLMPPNKEDRDILHQSGDYESMLSFIKGL